MTQPPYPSGLREIAFVQAYQRTTLRRPQVVSDTILRSLMTSGQEDRLVLVSSLADQLAEACRRLVAVHDALFDRRYPIAQVLLRHLPGAEDWKGFLVRATTLPPDAMLRDLGLGEEALPAAESLRGQPDLSWVAPVIMASETGNMLSLITRPESQAHRIAESIWVGSAWESDERPGAAIDVGFDDAATLADTTAEMVAIARGFLGAYLGARLSAGRREE